MRTYRYPLVKEHCRKPLVLRIYLFEKLKNCLLRRRTRLSVNYDHSTVGEYTVYLRSF